MVNKTKQKTFGFLIVKNLGREKSTGDIIRQVKPVTIKATSKKEALDKTLAKERKLKGTTKVFRPDRTFTIGKGRNAEFKRKVANLGAKILLGKDATASRTFKVTLRTQRRKDLEKKRKSKK